MVVPIIAIARRVTRAVLLLQQVTRRVIHIVQGMPIRIGDTRHITRRIVAIGGIPGGHPRARTLDRDQATLRVHHIARQLTRRIRDLGHRIATADIRHHQVGKRRAGVAPHVIRNAACQQWVAVIRDVENLNPINRHNEVRPLRRHLHVVRRVRHIRHHVTGQLCVNPVLHLHNAPVKALLVPRETVIVVAVLDPEHQPQGIVVRRA